MNKQLTVTALIIIGLVTWGMTGIAEASDNYDRLKKDIKVMMGIVRSAFEVNEDCPRCSVSIEGHYLADQGIVFNVSPHTRGFFAVPAAPGAMEFHAEAFIASLPDVVHEIIDDVEISIEDGNYTIINGDNWSEVSDEVREQLREARIKTRELNREMRELKIEAMNAEREALRDIEERERELEMELRKLSEQEESLSENVTVMIKKRKEERDARTAEREAKRLAEFGKMEKIVLDTFCDYSRTMRALPKGERVSIIMKQEEGDSKIYVMKKDDVENCDSESTDLRQHALSYAF